MLGDRGGDQPPLPHAWEGGLITDMLQEAWPEGHITKDMVLSLGEAILFFGRWSKNEGLPYCRARGIEFDLGGPFNWARRSVQIEALRENHAGRLPCHPSGYGREEDEGQRAMATMQKNKAPQNSSCSLWCWGVDVSLNRRFLWGAQTKWWCKPWIWLIGVTICSRGAEVTEGVSGREPHSFPGNLQEAHHLQEETVQMDRMNAVQGIQTRLGFLG